MRLAVNGHVVQYLGTEKGRHLFRSQTEQRERSVFDLLLTQSEVGRRTHLVLQAHKQSWQEELRPAGSGKRAAWIITSSTLSVGRHELLILELASKSPWGAIELEVTEPEKKQRVRPTASEKGRMSRTSYIVATVAIAVVCLWLIREFAL